MKTRLSILIACVLLTQVSMAQFNVGIKGGVNMSKVDGKAFSEEFKYGYHLGGFVSIGLGGRLGVQPEVLFNQYQTRTDSSFKNVYQNATNTSSYQNVKLNYLSIPIMLNYKLGNILTLQAGPQYGILLDQNKNLLQNGQEAFKHGDFSLAGGAQLNITKIRLSARYYVGLTNVSDISNQDKWKNQGWQLSAGFSL